MLGLDAGGALLLPLCVSNSCCKYVRNGARDIALLVDCDVFVAVEVLFRQPGLNNANVS
jgi:hypothetical protein